ncbi:MAG: archaeosortase A [Candidatus Thermoplasmatota archaeon]|nr:archaeosortase A [Candidatus Thermoplasmatota archaeon]MBS3790232.1 archaeosortase A [Candidatus Thermoplasmatota archaeon]
MNFVLEIMVWLGAILLLVGYLWDFKKHLFRLFGYILLGIFWLGEVPYYLALSDYFNAVLCFIVLPLFAYFGYNEFLSQKWEEDPEVMRFLAGGISIASLIYFGVQRIPLLTGFLIRIVAEHTVFFTNLLGYDFTIGALNYGGNPLLYRTNYESIWVPIKGSGIRIILACTGLQVMAAAGGLITSTKAKLKPKIISLLIVLPTVYIANVARNVMIIYLTYEDIVSFDMAHNQIAKTGSTIVLIILMLIVFEIMPEFYDNIISIVKLPKREPIHQKQQEES